MSARSPSRKRIAGLWMAQRRAEETRRADRLFEDPLAARFVAAAGSASPPSWAAPGRMKDYFAVRTRYFDDYLLKATQAGCRQVIILAAGLDARAFRLNWPASTRVFEIDLPEVLEFKDEVVAQVGLKPLCERHVVPADLRGQWAAALTDAGLVRDQKSVWLAEGILMYLSREEGDSLVKSISRLAEKESQLALEHVRRKPKKTLAFSTALFLLARLGSPWRSGVDDPVAWLARFGWTAKAHDPVKVASSDGRTMPGPAQGWLVEGLRTAE